jgi:predicted aspartyl protease
MSKRSLQLRTTLAYAQGAYTVRVELGSERRVANLLLDTGSSTLVVLPQAYDPDSDAALTATSLAQTISYGQGSWAGPVLQSQLAFGEGQHARLIGSAALALVEAAAQNFRNADGLLGLAYAGLDHAYDFDSYLRTQGTEPALTWPWPFTSESDDQLSHFRTLAHGQRKVEVTPCFTALESEGVVADCFALLIRRALVHVLHEHATPEQLVGDPLNGGVLVLGGGEECESLYEGALHSIRIVHDLYYNANLLAIRVGGGERIAAPALQQQYQESAASNAIIDTGSSFLILEQSLYDAVIAGFRMHNPALPGLIERFQQAFHDEQGLPNSAIDHQDWPDLHFYLEAADGTEVALRCPPAQYWPHNALHAGQSLFLLMAQLAHWPNQSILGLPLLSGHFCIFDRRAGGNGVVRVARARDAH